MIRKLIIALSVFAIVLAGFSLQGGGSLKAAEASGVSKALSDCARMMDMQGDHDNMDCPSTDHSQDSSMKCPADNCTLRCGIVSVQTAVSFDYLRLPIGLPEPLPSSQAYGSSAGKPPLPPPRSSILA